MLDVFLATAMATQTTVIARPVPVIVPTTQVDILVTNV